MNLKPSAPPEYFYHTKSKGDKIKDLINKLDIDPLFSEKLSLLDNYEIVLLLDDSGSMNTPLDDHTSHNTRWDELKDVVSKVIEISTIYDENGIDIYFLNRRPIYNVKSLELVNRIFSNSPYGSTPLTDNLQYIFNQYENSLKPVLVVIATDGVPNKNGYSDLSNFKKLLLEKNHSKFFISFLACSDDDNDIGYLNNLDKNVPNIDTLDDYISEKKEVLNVQGKNFSYTYGDHIVRLLLGPICQEWDNLDEKKLGKKTNNLCLCNIL